MSFDAHANFAVSTVATAPSPASSGTSLVVATGDGAKFPAVPFNATVWPASSQPTTANAEIVRVTGISTDTFTITRTQESTSARTIVVGDQIAATVTAKTITDVEAKTVTEYDYVEKTTNVTITATADGNSNGTAIIDGNAVTYDGSTRIKIEVNVNASVGSNSEIVLNLYDGTTDLGRMAFQGTPGANLDQNLYAARFLTPSAATHTYHIRGWKVGSGTVSVYGGAGGASTNMPAWYRITKA